MDSPVFSWQIRIWGFPFPCFSFIPTLFRSLFHFPDVDSPSGINFPGCCANYRVVELMDSITMATSEKGAEHSGSAGCRAMYNFTIVWWLLISKYCSDPQFSRASPIIFQLIFPILYLFYTKGGADELPAWSHVCGKANKYYTLNVVNNNKKNNVFVECFAVFKGSLPLSFYLLVYLLSISTLRRSSVG